MISKSSAAHSVRPHHNPSTPTPGTRPFRALILAEYHLPYLPSPPRTPHSPPPLSSPSSAGGHWLISRPRGVIAIYPRSDSPHEGWWPLRLWLSRSNFSTTEQQQFPRNRSPINISLHLGIACQPNSMWLLSSCCLLRQGEEGSWRRFSVDFCTSTAAKHCCNSSFWIHSGLIQNLFRN